jgi:catechol 2,3-dioxygenase-like lactoylglutathione lyase family enzyme
MSTMPDLPRPRLGSVAPVLLVTDVVRSEAYYRERLGFEPGRLFGTPPDFCIQDRDGLSVMLAQSPIVTPHWRVVHQMWSAYFWVDDAAALFDELVGRGATIDYGLGMKPYGVLEFGVQDPDGHDIGFGEVKR